MNGGRTERIRIEFEFWIGCVSTTLVERVGFGNVSGK